MLVPAFQLQLGEKIQRGLVALGKFDGEHTSIVCATAGGKLFVHSPHTSTGPTDAVVYLNVNKKVTALTAGVLDAGHGRAYLLVGSPGSLQCYDVHLNRDVFFKEIAEGVSVLQVGWLGQFPEQIAICGGNCAVQGFSRHGTDVLWTVSGDHVGALALADVDGDGKQELLVGSADAIIRIFQQEEMMDSLQEADEVVTLCSLGGSRWGYALANGTIGLYEGTRRVWRYKSKHVPVCCAAFDLDGDGQVEMVSGWSSGKIEVRRLSDGHLVCRDTMGAPVAGMLVGDYRSDGTQQLVVLSCDGEVRGYLPQQPGSGPAAPEVDLESLQATITQLGHRKQELLYEMASYQKAATAKPAAGAIPGSTCVESFVSLDRDAAQVSLTLRTNNDCVIKGAVLFGEQVFEAESMFFCPKTPDTQVSIALRPQRDVAIMLLAKVLVGVRGCPSYHVLELEVELPKYACYAAMDKTRIKEPQSSVALLLPCPLHRLVTWVESSFSVKASLGRGEAMEACLMSLRDRSPLVIQAAPAGQQMQVTIKSDNMDLAGDLVQELASYLSLQELQCTADFPEAFASFQSVLQQVEEANGLRLRMAADVADSSGAVKALVVRAEDARLLGDMEAMMKFYRQLRDVNRDLITDQLRRGSNQAALLEALRQVNQMIQRAAKLRVGAAKGNVVAACRAALKANNPQALMGIIRSGGG